MKQFDQETFLNDLSFVAFSILYIFQMMSTVVGRAHSIKSLMIMHLLLLTQSIILLVESSYIVTEIQKIERVRDCHKRRFNKMV